MTEDTLIAVRDEANGRSVTLTFSDGESRSGKLEKVVKQDHKVTRPQVWSAGWRLSDNDSIIAFNAKEVSRAEY